MSTKKKATKKSPAKKAAAKKAPAKNVTKATAKKSATKKAAAKKAPAKKAAAKPAAKKASSKRADSTPTPPSERVIPAKYKYLHDQAWLDGQREALLRERANYTTSADRLAAEAAALMADREPGDVQFDEESGEGDTIAVERDRDLALSAAARQSVAEIDAALARLDANTYGMCTAGDDIIPRERLEAIPEAAVCVMHKTLMFS